MLLCQRFRLYRRCALPREKRGETFADPVSYTHLDVYKRQPAGSEGLILLPHFGGAGAPETNQYAKGLLYGLSLQHTKAHIIRAFLEATAMNIRRMIDYAERVTGQPVEEVRTLGGAAKSPLWCQIKADVLGRRVVTMKNTQDAAALDVYKRQGFAWLDTGTMDSLVDAADFVRMVEKRQGIKISAPEEIAYKNDWITREKLLESAERYGKSPYGQHLKQVADGKLRY